MYDPPLPGKALVGSDEDSSPKCIRPLASEPLLRPGHDEIHTLRSRIIVRAEARFLARVYDALNNCFVITFTSLAFRPPFQAIAGSFRS